MKSYISPKTAIEIGKNDKGLFVIKEIIKGEIIVDYTGAPGKVMSTTEADILFDQGKDYMIQIDEDLFFVATNKKELEDSDFINHSCNPNCGIKGKLQIIAMRNIKIGEEVTIDYAMSESSLYSMQCRCEEKQCRRVITGDDWKRTELQKKYKGYFSKYLQKKINALHV